jgi:glutaredoxin
MSAVVVFSQSFCPHSAATKTLLQQLGAPFKAIELDEYTDGAAIKDVLKEMTGAGTTPRTFIAGLYAGDGMSRPAEASHVLARRGHALLPAPCTTHLVMLPLAPADEGLHHMSSDGSLQRQLEAAGIKSAEQL